MPFSTTNAVIDPEREPPEAEPDTSAAAAVRRYTTRTSASGPFVIHIFVPFAIHPPSVRTAPARIDPRTSEPASASLMASAPTCVPDSNPGNHRARWSGVPCSHRLCTHRLECAA